MFNTKYIFITGGVVSGLGKGITAASLGRLLVNRGLSVIIQKLDPYLNLDPGTMNPLEHGEVFVTDDGAETDLDIGHYERFLGRSLSKKSSVTMGQIYQNTINKERKGDFLGKTIQVVPHVTNEIKNTMRGVADGNDIVIVEIGGTVGDLESTALIEAIRQFRRELGNGNSLSIHVTLVPYLNCSNEIKTLPTRHSVNRLSEMGVFPDIVVCRTNGDVLIDKAARDKIAMFCSLDSPQDVIHNHDCSSIYEVPVVLKKQKLDDIVLEKLGLTAPAGNLNDWKNMVIKLLSIMPLQRTIAIVGKYLCQDAYLSVIESIKHAGAKCGVGIKIKLISCEDLDALSDVDGIIVPGGFGSRGVEGKIAAIKYARENNIPFLGICLGMQMAVVEFARNVLGLKEAHSTEMTASPYPVIDLMESQKNVKNKGGTMRLGLYDCTLKKGTRSAKLYNSENIKERHRHRYEFNNKYREDLEKAGLVISGVNKELDLVEIIELKDHPYFVACQFHPELVSRPYSPHPLFVGLVNATKEINKENKK